MKGKKKNWIKLLVIVLVLIILGGVGFIVYKKVFDKNTNNDTIVINSDTSVININEGDKLNYVLEMDSTNIIWNVENSSIVQITDNYIEGLSVGKTSVSVIGGNSLSYNFDINVVSFEDSNQIAVSKQYKIHTIDDVASGYLIEGNGEYALIDTGMCTAKDGCKQAERVATYLKTLGVKKLKFILITHPHKDHLTGLETVVKKSGVTYDKVYMKSFETCELVSTSKNLRDVNGKSSNYGCFNTNKTNMIKDAKKIAGKKAVSLVDYSSTKTKKGIKDSDLGKYVTESYNNLPDVGGIKFKVYNIGKTLLSNYAYKVSENEASLVVLALIPKTGGGTYKAVFTGDSNNYDTNAAIFSEIKKQYGYLDFMTMPHHGHLISGTIPFPTKYLKGNYSKNSDKYMLDLADTYINKYEKSKGKSVNDKNWINNFGTVVGDTQPRVLIISGKYKKNSILSAGLYAYASNQNNRKMKLYYTFNNLYSDDVSTITTFDSSLTVTVGTYNKNKTKVTESSIKCNSEVDKHGDSYEGAYCVSDARAVKVLNNVSAGGVIKIKNSDLNVNEIDDDE